MEEGIFLFVGSQSRRPRKGTAAMNSATLVASSASTFSPPVPAAAGFVTSTPKWLLRVEGLAMMVAAAVAYRALGGGWGFFAALFLVPDLSMLGYLAGRRVGAAVYNAGHSLIGPALLAGVGLVMGGQATALLLALIWVAHVGFDRAAGYGLKYDSAFADTHLGRVGRARSEH